MPHTDYTAQTAKSQEGRLEQVVGDRVLTEGPVVRFACPYCEWTEAYFGAGRAWRSTGRHVQDVLDNISEHIQEHWGSGNPHDGRVV